MRHAILKMTVGKFFLLLFSFLVFTAGLITPAYSDTIELTDGWQYRVGDSPITNDNIPEWILSENDDPHWKAISIPADVPDRGSNTVVWFRIRLPGIAYTDAAVHCANIDQSFTLYAAGQRIYAYGSEKHYLSSFGTHIVPLDTYRNRYLYMRVYSGWSRIGMYTDKLRIGSRADLQKNILKKDFNVLILSILLMITGLCIILASFFSVELLQLITVGMFTLLFGLFSFTGTESKALFFGNNYMFWGPVRYLSFMWLPACITLFVCRFFNLSWKHPVKWLAAGSAAYAVFSLAAAVIYPDLLSLTYPYNALLCALTASSLILFALMNYAGADFNSRLILVSIFIIAICAGYDLMRATVIVPENVRLTLWGQLISIIILLSVIIRNWIRSRNELTALGKELDIARRIQLSIVPSKIPSFKGISTDVQFRPIQAVGGDLYDYYTDEQGGIGILIADVAGHGIPAALIASMVNAAFFINRRYAEDPVTMLETINTALLRKCGKYFVTALYVYIQPDRSALHIARAGHHPLLIYRKQTGIIDAYLPEGKMLGRVDSAGCMADTAHLACGDRIILYSDGIPETRNSAGEMFGMDRFYNAIRSAAEMNPARCSRFLTGEVLQWGGTRSIEDDITLLVVDITE